MPQVSKCLTIKRSHKTLLAKNRHFLRNFPVSKSYKPLCKQLRNNNHSLAKALSKEKHENQMLYSENIKLAAMVQELDAACNKRNIVISNVLSDSKEMLQIIVRMSGYLTRTISSCQDFVRSANTRERFSRNSITKKRESLKKFSIQSPTKVAVKPMVNGYTITKPTINLSRLNVLNINNPSNLSMIPEVATPPRNEESDNSVSPRQRHSIGRRCRMPVRVAVTRNSEESEPRLSKRNSRHTERLSNRLSKSRSSMDNNSSQSNIENFDNRGSPTVKLNDVSKLLRNSQSINIRMLTKEQHNLDAKSDSSDSTSHESLDSKSHRNKNANSNNELDERKNIKTKQNCTLNLEDPLEGPSWLFNNSERPVPSLKLKDDKTDSENVSDDSSIDVALNTLVPESDESDNEIIPSLTSPLPSSMNETKTIPITERNEDECETQNGGLTTNSLNFITQRRGCFNVEDEDEDDFTLIFPKRRNVAFDINDLKLPDLEQSVVRPQISAEPEPEVTSNISLRKICPIPLVSEHSLNESAFNQSVVKLPTLIEDDYNNKELTPFKKEPKQKRKKKAQLKIGNSLGIEDTPPLKKKNSQKRRKNMKDPSTAKVVLEKLNESNVKTTSPSLNEISSSTLNQCFESTSPGANNNSDSESNGSFNGSCTRLRKRAPTTLQEPSLRSKLRRN